MCLHVHGVHSQTHCCSRCVKMKLIPIQRQWWCLNVLAAGVPCDQLPFCPNRDANISPFVTRWQTGASPVHISCFTWILFALLEEAFCVIWGENICLVCPPPHLSLIGISDSLPAEVHLLANCLCALWDLSRRENRRNPPPPPKKPHFDSLHRSQSLS